MSVTTRVKQLRLSLGLTQLELSQKSGVPVQTISRYENDHATRFDADVLDRLSQALQVEPGFLLVRKG